VETGSNVRKRSGKPGLNSPRPSTRRRADRCTEAPLRPQPEFTTVDLDKLHTTGPVANYGRHRELPSTRDALSHVMRFCLLNNEGSSAAWLVTELFERGRDQGLTLCLGCPRQPDEQGPLTDESLAVVLGWIEQWVPLLQAVSITLDLSGNRITPHGVQQLGDCLGGRLGIEALDLSRNSFVIPPLRRKKTLTKTQTIKKVSSLVSPRGKKEREPRLSSGEAIATLLASSHLRQIRLNDNPFRREDRSVIIDAIGKCSTLHTVGMANCGLSEGDIAVLVGLSLRNQWRHLAMGAKFSLESVKLIATRLLPRNRTLVTLDLGTTEKQAWLDVAELFVGLKSNRRLEKLSLAGQVLQGIASAITDAMRQNNSLRALDLSRCDIQESVMEAIMEALRRTKLPPNETLIELIFPAFDDQDADCKKHGIWARACAIAIERNRTLEWSRSRAAPALYAGFRSAGAPLDILSPALCRQIVDQISDVPSLHDLALVCNRPPRPQEEIPWPQLPTIPSQSPHRSSTSGKR
jgi:hypothetical protein